MCECGVLVLVLIWQLVIPLQRGPGVSGMLACVRDGAWGVTRTGCSTSALWSDCCSDNDAAHSV
jgi:hypothetical protein